MLAREVYDRCLAGDFGRVHRADLALITGEEKILPPKARYFICTTEAMPISREVEFVAIDECQLSADAERGHVFTDRMLHQRGTAETILLGAATMAPILRQLLGKINVETRARFSRLLAGAAGINYRACQDARPWRLFRPKMSMPLPKSFVSNAAGPPW